MPSPVFSDIDWHLATYPFAVYVWSTIYQPVDQMRSLPTVGWTPLGSKPVDVGVAGRQQRLGYRLATISSLEMAPDQRLAARASGEPEAKQNATDDGDRMSRDRIKDSRQPSPSSPEWPWRDRIQLAAQLS